MSLRELKRRPPSRPVEHIAAAALRVRGEVWTLPPPARHHVLVHAWCSAHWRDGEPAQIPSDHEQGFVTNAGRFVDRYEAMRIARAAGQTTSAHPQLFSEDVW